MLCEKCGRAITNSKGIEKKEDVLCNEISSTEENYNVPGQMEISDFIEMPTGCKI